MVDADLNGEKKHAIFTGPPSRIIWKVKIPEDGWIKALIGHAAGILGQGRGRRAVPDRHLRRPCL